MAPSTQKKLERVRPPRVAISYEVETGGAIETGTLALIVGSLISNNTARRGGGIYSRGAVILESTTITNNNAEVGAGICWESPGSLQCDTSSVISQNRANFGGGVAASMGSFSINLDAGGGAQCSINSNTANYLGGGVLLFQTTDVQLFNVEIALNNAGNGAGIHATNSTVSVTQGSINSNNGGGLVAISSYINLQSSGFKGNSLNLSIVDLNLVNSSALIPLWHEVTITSPESFQCNDCLGKLCAAAATCADCRDGCMTMGTQPVCTEESFPCGQGTCTSMSEQKPQCACPRDYSGDTCQTHDSPAKSYLWIIGFVVGCLAVLVIVILVIVRFHKRRSEDYRPLLR